MGPESGPFAAVHPVSSPGWAAEGDGGLDRVVHGRERELRVIAAFATGVDPTTLVVSGLSGIGKSVTVLAALRRIEARHSTVRVVRSGTARPYAHGPSGLRRLDLSAWTVPAGPEGGHHLDPDGLMDAVSAGSLDLGPGPRVLFVDDVDTLAPPRVAWLQRLADVAYERGWRVVAATRHAGDEVLPDELDSLVVGPLDEAALRQVLDAALRQPVAADVAARLHRWSAGNVRIALELADPLSAAQLRGSAGWAGPDVVGPAARRAYRVLLDRLTPAETERLATAVPGPDGHGAEHPLLALLCRERAGGTGPAPGGGRSGVASAAAGPSAVDPAAVDPAAAGLAAEDPGPGDQRSAYHRDRSAVGSAVETVLDGLYLDDLPGAPSAHDDPRVVARAVGVALLTGTTWAGAVDPWQHAEAGTAWSGHLWWTDGAGGPERAAGARVAAALVALERTGQVPDPARLRADLDLLAATSGRHWVGVCVQVRGHLLLGDVAGARRLLDGTRTATDRTVAELVAREVAEARVAMVEGRAADVRDHLDRARRLRPAVEEWLPVRGLRIVADALLDGQVPPGDVPPAAGSSSTRALGEFAGDLGLAHLAVGQAERAAELFTIGLERCSWPYRGRVHARADLVEAVAAAGHTRDGIPERVSRLVEPPVAPEERSAPDAVAAHTRMRALLSGPAALATGIDGWLPAAPPPVSPWQRLRSLVAYGRHCLAYGDRAASEPALREARTLAPLAGAPGWRTVADGAPAGGVLDAPAWDRLDDNEREIVRLALGGATYAQIAAAAYLSVRSVANRLRSIYLMLGLRDRRDLVERAQAAPPGWLTDPP